MKFEKISMCPGSYLIEVGSHDIIYAPADASGYFPRVAIRYDQPTKRGDAFTKRYCTCLFEDDHIVVTATYSSHEEFDGKLLGVDVIRKAFS